MSNAARVVGHVRGPDHEPLPDTVVTVTTRAGDRVGRASAGDDGSFAIEVPTGGTYVLIAAAPGHQPMATSVAIAAEEVRRDLSLVRAGSLAGTVRDTEGEPVAGATLSVTDARGDVVATTSTGDDGRWSLSELYPGGHTVVAAGPGLRPRAQEVVIEGDTVCDLVLTGRGSLTGAIRVAGSGSTVPDASVVLVDAEGRTSAETVSGTDGMYRFSAVRAGTYTVLASGYAPAAIRVQVGTGAVDGRDLELSRDVGRDLPRGRHAPVVDATAVDTTAGDSTAGDAAAGGPAARDDTAGAGSSPHRIGRRTGAGRR